jgi:putative methyltransferase (TIGR04325 family)
VGTLGRVAKSLPFVNDVREREYARRFVRPDHHGWFFGKFSSFSEANANAPSGMKPGLDRYDYAKIFDERLERVYAYDYPPMFWLAPLLAEGKSVFDLGGHIGVTWYGYKKYLPVEKCRWRVCDLPEVVRRGREVAQQRGAATLEFTSDAQEADGFDIFFAAGSLQYVERPELAELLKGLKAPPRHLLLNKLPLQDGPRFVTLQNAQVALAPQYVFNDRDFIGSLTALGYELVDRWEDPVHSCRIPFHDEQSVPHYAGLYLRRAASG